MRLCILGSTGSIGVSTLDVVSRHPERFKVHALTAHRNHQLLLQQCHIFKPAYAVIGDADSAASLQEQLKSTQTRVLYGPEALAQVAADDQVDAVMAAIVGAAGLLPTLAGAEAGKRILLANKEALVMAGKLFMQAVEKNAAELLPIDSEHNAIFQCMPAKFTQGLDAVGIEKILLTASGGPFRTFTKDQMVSITPEQACAHPNWDMGRKISVDSASMMNKGLEVIEASWLFHCGVDRIQVVVHPQSVIHSMVSYKDGSVLAQMGNPDMRTPIAHAMAWPERIESGVSQLDLFEVARLDFQPPDLQQFPCLRLAYQAAEVGRGLPVVLNAANEVAVAAFLNHRLAFIRIAEIIESAMQELSQADFSNLEELIQLDQETRHLAEAAIDA